MSRGQKPRIPEHFPRMKWRGRGRVEWTIVICDQPPGLYCGPARHARRALAKARR